ncbi:uncharacterized protein LOC116007032 [Ipomoea triloba]|uniref:uncharacterized protein LOC116007032 n=1 Tax=Ipomoea triloba TaxID=35885 RepID=UPI00125DDE50|nr:uncharacterized protein LOC116007032 [Ipomoea triloba]XP_031103459.1 uncharacterized protein LOC116007032 [Ipomoea triloba]
MEKEGKNQRASETEFFLQWGSRKRLRCVRVRGPDPSSSDATRLRRKISSRFLTVSAKDAAFLPPRHTRNSETAALRSENRRSASRSPEKEERCYPTRGSAEENGKVAVDGGGGNLAGNHAGDESNRGVVWPKLYITLSSKEKEEDFMAMKGCKLPQRPKKRAKIIQRTLLLVSPGAWLTDMSLERYEVREKKSTKKRARGLKAMGSVESDSE